MSLAGLRVVSFESRRSVEIAELVRRHGGEPRSAPSLREIPLSENPAAHEFAERLARGEIDIVIFLTGVGTRLLIEAVTPALPPSRFASALSTIITIARGPKPRAALAELGLRPTIVVPEPNTWRELLAAIDARVPVSGRTVAVQEYGAENPELVGGLTDRGGTVLRVPIYRWALPDDLEPLRAAIADLLDGRIDVALFTSATQVEHLFRVAGKDQRERLRAALDRVVVASVGPICTSALAAHGVRADLEPEHPKMGPLVLAASERAVELLRGKHATQP
ncbi:MAG TPA: uroporphyrinogen-III synthase [Candidatus Binatia bacterium]|nr:uroporphyrinogen-III synthase [Candidatus Binatia bacterium]